MTYDKKFIKVTPITTEPDSEFIAEFFDYTIQTKALFTGIGKTKERATNVVIRQLKEYLRIIYDAKAKSRNNNNSKILSRNRKLMEETGYSNQIII